MTFRIAPLGFFVLLAGGIGSLGYGAWLVWCQARLAQWPMTTATIVSFDPGIDPDWGGHWYAHPQVRFVYEVNGQRYSADRFNPSPFNYQSEARFSADTDEFEDGAKVTCRYNPSRPTEAYLISAGVTTAPVLLMSGGAICLALAGSGTILRRRRSAPAARP